MDEDLSVGTTVLGHPSLLVKICATRQIINQASKRGRGSRKSAAPAVLNEFR
jgi:hypothetical protein